MNCPKCNQTFEEGSRRFCPTDGARLISEMSNTGVGSSGVFSKLLPKIETSSEFDEAHRSVPRSAVPITEPASSPIQQVDDDFFFDLDDPDVDTLPAGEIGQGAVVEAKPAPVTAPPTARKIDPVEIPAGHVDLTGADRNQPFNINFDRDSPESFVGRMVKGRYKVMEFLGGDENSLAYLADDKIVGDKKVLLRILLSKPANDMMRTIMEEERVSLSHFSHPNVARLIDSGSFSNRVEFLVSEYVDSLSVADVLSIHGHLDGQRTGRIIRQLAGALSEAHQEGILHRDLRPENLILDESSGEGEQAKLVNFGASLGEPTPQNVAYKSPEVLEGRIATIASDVFSLAVVAYEMMTGQLPFAGSTAKEIIRSQNAGSAARPTELMPDLSPAVDEVLVKAMSYDRADRYTKARDFGDALYAAVTAIPPRPAVESEIVYERAEETVPQGKKPVSTRISVKSKAPNVVTISPATGQGQVPAKVGNEPAWKNRSPEPPAEENSRTKWLAAAGILLMLSVLGIGIYYLAIRPDHIDVPSQAIHVGNENGNVSTIVSTTEMPPLSRTIPQPPNSVFFQNTKQNLKGDLLRNFVGFTMYIPNDWKVLGPQQGTPTVRGKYIDISSNTPDNRMKEQMLVGYYPSSGTFNEDTARFPALVKETNETLKNLLPGYQMVSEGEIKLNGDWRAYEIRFQAGGTLNNGENLVVWGRRLYVPAARPGARNGFEITMLATSYADDIRSVDDVGVKGGLAAILYSFEPTQNF